MYDGQRREATDEARRNGLKGLTKFAHAAFAISGVVAIHSREVAGSSHEESKKFLPDAVEAIPVAHGHISIEAYQALRVLLQEVKEEIEQTPV